MLPTTPSLLLLSEQIMYFHNLGLNFLFPLKGSALCHLYIFTSFKYLHKCYLFTDTMNDHFVHTHTHTHTHVYIINNTLITCFDFLQQVSPAKLLNVCLFIFDLHSLLHKVPESRDFFFTALSWKQVRAQKY